MTLDFEALIAALCVVILLAMSYVLVMLVFVWIPLYKRNQEKRKEMEETAKRIRAGAIQKPSNRWYVHGTKIFPTDKK